MSQINEEDFTQLNDLACENNGGTILFATDEWFAEADNLIKDSEPEWREGEFTHCGKWMDGWETRRKRIPGHDWTIIKLGVPGEIRGCLIDTAFFTGNYAPRFSLQAANLTESDLSYLNMREPLIGVAASAEDFEAIANLESEKWTELISMTPLQSGCPETHRNLFPIHKNGGGPWTHIRLNIYPDGGLARLRIYGVAKCDWSLIAEDQLIDLAAMKSGGECTRYSNAHYGHPKNLIRSGVAKNMGDGWETARRLDRPPILTVDSKGRLQVPGEEWAELRLGQRGVIDYLEIDTRHFKGNYPDTIRIEGTDSVQSKEEWITILPNTKLSAHRVHKIEKDELKFHGPFTHLRITIAPDGGISRLRAWGRIRLNEI